MDELFLIHRTLKYPFQFEKGYEGRFLTWKTCLRQIIFCPPELGSQKVELLPGDEVYQGAKAYSFSLEVICGLKSHIIGETEVLGQFKTFIGETSIPESVWGSFIKRTFRSLLLDVKVIRNSHLTSIGSHSYGSFARRYLKGQAALHFVGAGQLVQSMLPWFNKEQTQIQVFSLNPGKHLDLQTEYPKIKLNNIVDRVDLQGSIVLAAPITAAFFTDWFLPRDKGVSILLDLRDTSAVDPLKLPTNVKVIGLHDFFSELQSNQKTLEAKVQQAVVMIEDLTQARELQSFSEVRPFGWEDLCG